MKVYEECECCPKCGDKLDREFIDPKRCDKCGEPLDWMYEEEDGFLRLRNIEKEIKWINVFITLVCIATCIDVARALLA